MIRNRTFRIVVAAIVACFVALIASVALGFLLLMSLQFVLMPQSELGGILVACILLAIFGFTFVVSFREMREQLAPDSQSSSSS